MNKCLYCDEPMYNNPFTMMYAERVRSLLKPWAYVHKVPQHGIAINLVANWPTLHFKRERCTK